MVVEECPETFVVGGDSPARQPPESDEAEAPLLAGPAFAAGLREGDELVRFAGYVVTDLLNFNAIVSRHVKIGAKVAVEFRRPGAKTTSTGTIVVVGK